MFRDVISLVRFLLLKDKARFFLHYLKKKSMPTHDAAEEQHKEDVAPHLKSTNLTTTINKTCRSANWQRRVGSQLPEKQANKPCFSKNLQQIQLTRSRPNLGIKTAGRRSSRGPLFTATTVISLQQRAHVRARARQQARHGPCLGPPRPALGSVWSEVWTI